MPLITEDIVTGADWIAQCLKSSGYSADFSPASLWEIDRFFDDVSENGAPKQRGLLGEQFGSRMFALGGYVGEVLRRSKGGSWLADEADPENEIDIILKFPDGSIVWPIQRVIKRLKNGPEDGIGAYGAGLGLDVGPQPPPRKKGFFSRLFGG